MKKIYTVLFFALLCAGASAAPCPDEYPNNLPNTDLCYLITKPGEYVPYTSAGPQPCPSGNYCPGGDKIYYNAKIFDRYKMVEYLENNATAYIDTGHTPTAATTISADVMITGGSKSSLVWIPFIGTQINDAIRYAFGINRTTGWVSFDYFTGDIGYYTDGGNFLNKRFNIKTQISDNRIYALFDNVSAYSVPVADAPDFTYGIYLFQLAGEYSARHSYGRFYYYQAYEADKLVQYMIPVYDTISGQYGMYDIIDRKFFTSANNDKFTGGPKILTSGGNFSCASATNNEFTSSPTKSDAIADCGKILHIGTNKLYLRRRQITHPALAVQWRDTILYAEMSTEKRGHLRTIVDGIAYSIFNINHD